MKQEKVSLDIQNKAVKMLEQLHDKEGIENIQKNLSNIGRDFWDVFLELRVGHALKNYDWKYEKIKLLDKFPDFCFRLQNMEVFIEVKNRHAEAKKELYAIHEQLLKILGEKSDKSYSCELYIKNIPAYKTEDEKFVFKEWLNQCTDSLSKISSNQIKQGNKVILVNESWYSKKSHRDYKIKIILEFLSESKKWDISYCESCELNDYFTNELLQDLLEKKNNKEDSLTNIFEGKTSGMGTIGIVDVTERESAFPIESFFDMETAKYIMENIMGQGQTSQEPVTKKCYKRLTENHKRITKGWYEKARDKVDALFLIHKRHNVEKFLSCKVPQNKKEIIEKIYDCFEMSLRGV